MGSLAQGLGLGLVHNIQLTAGEHSACEGLGPVGLTSSTSPLVDPASRDHGGDPAFLVPQK